MKHEAEGKVSDHRLAFGSFVWLAAQVGLVLSVAVVYQLELERGFRLLAAVTFLGFLVHSWLPLRWRLGFLLLLTLVVIGFLLWPYGIWLIVLSLGLLGLCHIPVKWSIRVGLVVTAAAGLAVIHAGWVEVDWAPSIIPVLGAMFMFRIILYLYDLRTERTPASLWARLAYFFLPANICFPLFPVVDYRSFLRSYYDSPAALIYQQGVYWMLRGVWHLILYRMVYYLLPSADSDLSGIFGVYVFMGMTYALYLRVSGLFHLITGMLCLFGFNLPRTNDHYFLASSFTDLWRRINIYWKDFMMTIVFYPIFLNLRDKGMSVRLGFATISVFIATWFLHSYQWFWLAGAFPITHADMIFWGILGIALAVNSIMEARRGRRRMLHAPSWDMRGAIWKAVRVWFIFSFMAVLWTLWDAGSILDWSYRLLRVKESGVVAWSLFVGLSGIVMSVGVLAQWLNMKGWGVWQLEAALWKNARATVLATSSVLLLVSIPSIYTSLGSPVRRVVLRAQSTTPNRIDIERRERGYYETLSRSNRLDLLGNTEVVDVGWVGFWETPAATRTNDIRRYTLTPNTDIKWRGARLTTNQWGMRDKDYTIRKPKGTYRIALLGSSHVMGLGVEDQETFDNRLESSLNENLSSPNIGRYEVLNFAVGGYDLTSHLYITEHSTPQFEPDVVLFVIHPREIYRTSKGLRDLLVDGREYERKLDQDFPFISRVLEKAGVGVELPNDEFHRRLAPYSEELLSWSYRKLADVIRAQGANPVFVFLPFPAEEFEADELRMLMSVTKDVGAIPILLTEVYKGHDPDRLVLSAWDDHTNAFGHSLIANDLLSKLKSSGLLALPDTVASNNGS